MSIQNNYEGSIPEIGGVLHLNTGNFINKIRFDMFCERLAMYIMKEFINSPDVAVIMKDIKENPAAIFELHNKLDDLTEEEKRSMTTET